nr:MAG TPA: hypothetical protein [Caudoviricetes sp.]
MRCCRLMQPPPFVFNEVKELVNYFIKCLTHFSVSAKMKA